MSGYFARLASLVQAPAPSTTGAKASIAPVPLEQDIESDATSLAPTVSGPGSTSARAHQDASTSMAQASTARPGPGLPADRRVRTVEALEPTASDAMRVMAAATLPVATAPLVSTDFAAQARTAGPASFRATPESPRKAWAPAAVAQSPAQPMHFTPSLAPRPDIPASVDGGAADALTPAAPLQGITSPLRASKLEPAHGFATHTGGDTWPGTSRAQAGSFDAATHATAATAAPRSEVRIGTISLEVRTSSPAPVTAPPQPAAAPQSTQAQPFTMRRHYLRWN